MRFLKETPRAAPKESIYGACLIDCAQQEQSSCELTLAKFSILGMNMVERKNILLKINDLTLTDPLRRKCRKVPFTFQ